MRVEQLLGCENRLDQLVAQRSELSLLLMKQTVCSLMKHRTPLIISGPVDNTYEEEIYKQSLALSDKLNLNEDYIS